MLDANQIESSQPTLWLGRPAYYYPVVGSTNMLLTEMARRGQQAGTIIITDFQTKGKGRLARRWVAPARTSLLFSLLLRPGWESSRLSELTMLSGLAAVDAIKAVTSLGIGLKWPNDLVVPSGDHWSKVGGFLLEGEVMDTQIVFAVLGIGINVNFDPDKVLNFHEPATSLMVAMGQSISRLQLLNSFLSNLETYLREVEKGWSPKTRWNDLLITIGRKVKVTDNLGNSFEGIAESTNEYGQLCVREPSGVLRIVSAGGVTLSG